MLLFMLGGNIKLQWEMLLFLNLLVHAQGGSGLERNKPLMTLQSLICVLVFHSELYSAGLFSLVHLPHWALRSSELENRAYLFQHPQKLV